MKQIPIVSTDHHTLFCIYKDPVLVFEFDGEILQDQNALERHKAFSTRGSCAVRDKTDFEIGRPVILSIQSTGTYTLSNAS